MVNPASHLMLQLLVAASGVCIGCGLLLFLNSLWLKTTWWVRAAGVAAVAGPCMVIWLVMDTILLRINEVPVTSDSVQYLIGLVLSAFGFVGITVFHFRLRQDRKQ